MEDLKNLIRREIALYLTGRATTRIGLVDSYDPNTHAAKVRFQPENTLSGWIPIGAAATGNNFGVHFAPNIEDQVMVHFLEGEHEAGVIGMRLYSDQDRPLPVPAGEMWIVHKTGSGLTLKGDGSTNITAHGLMQTTVGDGATSDITGDVTTTISGSNATTAASHTVTGDLTVSADNAISLSAPSTAIDGSASVSDGLAVTGSLTVDGQEVATADAASSAAAAAAVAQSTASAAAVAATAAQTAAAAAQSTADAAVATGAENTASAVTINATLSTTISSLDDLTATYGSTASAAASASAALTFANIASSVGNVSLVINPVFEVWPVGETSPTGWETWISGGAAPTQGAGIYSPYSAVVAGPAGVASGIAAKPVDGNTALAPGQLSQNAWVVLEADIMLGLGSLTGAGLQLNVFDASYSSLGAVSVDFTADQDVAGNVNGAGTVGQAYHFRKLVQITFAGASQGELYAIAHGPGFGHSTASANSVAFDRASVRFASGAEITAQQASASVATALASIASESTTRAAADFALGESISTVSTSLGDTNASVEINATALSTLSGQAYGSLSLTADSGNNITGLRILSASGPIDLSAIQLDANIITFNGVQPLVFNTSTGVLSLKDIVLSNPSGSITNNLSAGLSVRNNGTIMVVEGLGFGANSDLTYWYGPSMAVTACTKANGLEWNDVDGNIYTSATLSAGTLTTKAATSDISASAVAETAVFGSNGGTITVVLSYLFHNSGGVAYAPTNLSGFNAEKATISPAPTNDGSGNWSNGTNSEAATTVDLYRSLNGAAYVKVSTLSVSGSWTWSGTQPGIGGDPGFSSHIDNIGGSITFTDPDHLAENRQYKGVLNTRSAHFTDAVAQTITVICTE